MKLKSLALPLLACSALAQANLVVNGGFEIDVPFAWTIQPAAQGSNIAIANIGRTGNRSLAFSSTVNNFDFIRQSLTLVDGQEYEVSYWFNNISPGDDALGVTLTHGFNTTGLSHNPLDYLVAGGWQRKSFTITSTSTEGEIVIGGSDPNTFLIDDISVEAVPEPATFAVLAGIAAILKRRKNR